MGAYEYISKLSYVDPNRIYLGGHAFIDLNELLEAIKYNEDEEDDILDAKDITINTIKVAKQFTWAYDTGNGRVISNFTLIQTDNAFYILCIEAYEDDYFEIENELSAIPLAFDEIK